VGIGKRIWNLVRHGFQTAAHVHTVEWLLFDVFRIAAPTALITGSLIAFLEEHSAALLIIVSVFTLTASALLWLAGLGDREAISPGIATTADSRPAWIWGPPPDWTKLRAIWWLWLTVGMIIGIGAAQVKLPIISRDITWDDHPIAFEMEKIGSDYLIKAVKFRGKNTSGRGIYQFHTAIVSDRGSFRPIFLFYDGKWLDFDDVDVIPDGIDFITGCQIAKEKPNCGWEMDGMPPDQFMKYLGSFSVTSYVEGKEMPSIHFSIEKLEKEIAEAKNGISSARPVVKRKP
jgi:hypothetical protein